MNITEDEIKVFEFLSDGKEHFDAPDIEDYDDICEYYAELGLISLGESMDDGIKLTYKGKRWWHEYEEEMHHSKKIESNSNDEQAILPITPKTSDRKLAILLAARIATGDYKYISIADFVKLLKTEHPDIIDDETARKFQRRLHGKAKPHEIEKVKDQDSLISFSMSLNKQVNLRNDNRDLANKLFMKYNKKSK